MELCKRYKLDPMKDIVRHHDVTRKNCPAPWVKNGQAFEDFKKRVKLKMSDGNVYIVQKGDTLSKIAKQHNTTVGELQKLNGISNPDMIRIGQKLRVK